jgi:hypothetical protein
MYSIDAAPSSSRQVLPEQKIANDWPSELFNKIGHTLL